MKYLILIFWFVTCCLYAQNDKGNLPSYETIVRYFYTKYSIEIYSKNQTINFEKRPDGWYVSVLKYNEYEFEVVKNELFWSVETNAYNQLSYNRYYNQGYIRSKQKKYLNQLLYNPSKEGYRSPFYGYKGWEKDVIEVYGTSKHLSDSLWYGLGRAYFSKASNFLYPNRQFTEIEDVFSISKGMNSLSSAQLKKYRYYIDKTIHCYNQVEKINPNFKTFAGSIKTKISNTHVTAYLDLKLHQNEKEANKELKKGLYSDLIISMAKNYLISCEPNAILFTGGENDTFPLLYVQAMYGFRTDVTVINMSLLNAPRYINHLREAQFDAQPIAISLTKEEIEGKNRGIIKIQDYISQLEVGQLIKFIKSKRSIIQIDSKSFHHSPSQNLILKNGTSAVEWNIQRNNMGRNELVFLDILSQNDWKRPINFVSSMHSKDFFGLKSYFQLNGLVYSLISDRKHSKFFDFDHLNTDIMYDNLMNKFTYKGFESISKLEKPQYRNYLFNFHQLAFALTENNQLELAENVLDKFSIIFPNKNYPFGDNLYYILDDYYNLDKFEKANVLAKQWISNLNNLGSDNLDENKKRRSKFIISLIKRNNQEKILENLTITLE